MTQDSKLKLWLKPLAGAVGVLLLLTGATLWVERILTRASVTGPWDVAMQPVVVTDAQALTQVFDGRAYAWPPKAAVPALAVRSLPADLDSLDIPERKAAFFRTVLPLVLAENERIERKRAFLRGVFAEGLPAEGSVQRAQLDRLALRYRVTGDLSQAGPQQRLLRRIDVLPPALVLAQAANESAWGTSRFAQEGNSLFGLWTYDADEGLQPERREQGRSHSVRAHDDLLDSVRSYYYNLNVGHAYAALRVQRERMRAQGAPLDAMVLAGGLVRYSERGAEYVEEVRAMIRHNGLLEIETWVLGISE